MDLYPGPVGAPVKSPRFWILRDSVGYLFSFDTPGGRVEGWRPTHRWAASAARKRVRRWAPHGPPA